MTDTPLPDSALRGAVDLAALARAREAEKARTERAASGAPMATVVTEENLQSLAEQSMSVPIVIVFTSAAAPASETLAADVERLASEMGGFMPARCDVDAERGIAQAFQIQAVPAAMALIGARPAPLFQGSASEEQLREVLGQVMEVAAQAGLGGQAAPAPAAEGQAPTPEEPLPPLHQEAYDAIERGDMATAVAAYEKALQENPKDADARAGRAQVLLIQRTQGSDPQQVRAVAASAPDDVAAQIAVADIDVLGGQIEDAFARLLDVGSRVYGKERDAVRARLVELFDVVGPQDPRVAQARRSLAALLN
ncbi:co-chaperone YbbN [Demequina zhanjiangensis]|uniref:Tetratricopeptide repeat protein n=1 Tax=Demequina zhanjiangensis TaxID=3051659 RepID=A0ABT8FY32_9MICO|nr:tetratricopeptide repeat protein [Demequina sp. SYSU T00b26]MDN4471785.1 tetratricopeptide repeat protein [Demequina sp. SYSU T00b26]